MFDKSSLSPFDLPDNKLNFMWIWRVTSGTSSPTDLLSFYRAFSLTWLPSMQIYWNKRKGLHKKRLQLPKDWFGTPTWPPFHCFGTPIWRPRRHVKTLYRTAFSCFFNDSFAKHLKESRHFKLPCPTMYETTKMISC